MINSGSETESLFHYGSLKNYYYSGFLYWHELRGEFLKSCYLAVTTSNRKFQFIKNYERQKRHALRFRTKKINPDTMAA